MSDNPRHANDTYRERVCRIIGFAVIILVSSLICGCGTANLELNRPNLIAVSSDGSRLFISDSRNFRILVVDREFRLIREIPYSPEQAVWGMNPGTQGELVITDNRLDKATFDFEEKRANAVAEIQFLGPDGGIAHSLSWRSEKGPLIYPRQVLPLADGGVAVTDLRVNKVLVFERNGTLRMSIGEYGDADGRLYCPSDVLVDREGKFLVVDSFNHRISEFDRNGAWIRTIGRKGTGQGELLFPQNAARDANGRIYCTELGNMRVSVFEADGRFVRHIPMPTASGSSGLCELFGIACATAPAELFVADSINSSIYVFDLDGNHRGTIARLRP
ncbi:hypothetical protein KBA41_15035 [Candidatus Ozemobacteraceae bacterium]|nr:hypothetical protein [Candidatus Ozemobacteraceae bacterium]